MLSLISVKGNVSKRRRVHKASVRASLRETGSVYRYAIGPSLAVHRVCLARYVGPCPG